MKSKIFVLISLVMVLVTHLCWAEGEEDEGRLVFERPKFLGTLIVPPQVSRSKEIYIYCLLDKRRDKIVEKEFVSLLCNNRNGAAASYFYELRWLVDIYFLDHLGVGKPVWLVRVRNKWDEREDSDLFFFDHEPAPERYKRIIREKY